MTQVSHAPKGARTGEVEPPEARAFFRWLNRILGGLAAVLLFAIMVMTFCDVVGRYLFDVPLPGTYELTQVGLGLLIFAALPLVTERAEHVAIDLIDKILTPVGHRQLGIVLGLVGAAVMFGVAIVVWRQGMKVAADGLTTESLSVPLAPVVYFMAVCCVLSGIVLIRQVWTLRADH